MPAPIDFLILAPLNEERQAVLSHLPSPQRLPPDDQDVRVYYYSDIPTEFPGGGRGSYRVVVTSPLGMGQLEAATATADAIRRWQPRYVLLVGIAGGDPEEVALGDVLIGEQFVYYELQKLTDEGAQTRYQSYRADPRLYANAQHLASWQAAVRAARPEDGAPSGHFGVIISGEKVQAKMGALKPYKRDWPKLVGVEMEAIGVAMAAWQAPSKPGVLMIRGVSDLADANKGSAPVKKWRSYACDVAAAYAASLLRSGPVLAAQTTPSSPPVSRFPDEQSAASQRQSAANTAASSGSRPTLRSLRKLLPEVLRIDSDFMAFCLDFFPATEAMFTGGMDSEQKRNLLLKREDPAQILRRLQQAHQEGCARYAHLVEFEP